MNPKYTRVCTFLHKHVEFSVIIFTGADNVAVKKKTFWHNGCLKACPEWNVECGDQRVAFTLPAVI